MNNIIKTVNLSKSFFLKKNLNILKKISIEIKKGELVALLGPSGSGKSTFLHMIALLDQPSNGEIYFEGKKTSLMNDVEKDEMRGKKISIVYQQNNLLNDFTSLEKMLL
jgi:ABC-type lipoprotein export system ATPase subunit